MKISVTLLLLMHISLVALSQQSATFEKKLRLSGISKAIKTGDGTLLAVENYSDTYRQYHQRLSLLSAQGKIIQEKQLQLFPIHQWHQISDLLHFSDNTFLLLGLVADLTTGKTNAFFTKLDSQFNLLSTVVLEEEGSIGNIHHVKKTDGSLLLSFNVGYPSSTNKDSELFILHLDANLQIINRVILGSSDNLGNRNIGLVEIDEYLYATYTDSWGAWNNPTLRTTLVKLNQNLGISNTLHTTDVYATAVLKNKEQELVLLSEINSSTKLIRFSKALTLISEHPLTLPFIPKGFAQSHEGTYIIGGHSFTTGSKGFSFSLYNQAFEPIAEKRYYRSAGHSSDRTNGVLVTADGGFLLYGSIQNSYANQDYSYLLKTDKHGELPYPDFSQLHHTETGYTNEVVYGKRIFWIDLDQDGALELVQLAQHHNTVYRTTPQGTVHPAAVTFFPASIGGNFMSAADFDNDGDIDLYISASSFHGPYTYSDMLLLNDGTNTYLPAEGLMHTLGDPLSLTSNWIDVNADGYLDLILNTNANVLLHLNQGDGTFAGAITLPYSHEIAGQSTIYDRHFWYDVDKDGRIDLVIPHHKQLYLQKQPGQFTKTIFSQLFESAPHWDYSYWLADLKAYDITGDGREELLAVGLFTGISEKTFEVFSYNEEKAKWGVVPRSAHQIDVTNNPAEVVLVDFENDGDTDLFFYGHGNPYAEDYRFSLHLNTAGDTYTYLRNFPLSSRALFYNWVDIDQNGTLDLIKSDINTFEIWKNKSLTNNWLKVSLKGTISNNMGLAAVVEVYSQGKKQSQTLSDNLGFNGVIASQAHFGLGASASADSIVVRWPSGCYQVLRNLSANQVVLIEENCSGLPPTYARLEPLCSGDVLQVEITSPGTRFNWYRSLNGAYLGTSEASHILDTLTMSQTFFIANADSSFLSRKTALTVTVLPRPVATITLVADTLFASPAARYQWYVNNEVVEGPEGNRQYLLPKALGEYSLVVWGDNGCSRQSSIFDYRGGEPARLALAGMVLYPNPVSKTLHLSNPSLDYAYVITGIRGEIKQSGRTRAGQVEVHELPAGLYFLKLTDGTNVNTLKFIKMN